MVPAPGIEGGDNGFHVGRMYSMAVEWVVRLEIKSESTRSVLRGKEGTN